MKKNMKLIRIVIAAVVFIAGLVLGINGYTKRMSDSYAALKEAGTNGSVDMLYAIGLVLAIIGIVILITALTAPAEAKKVPIVVLAQLVKSIYNRGNIALKEIHQYLLLCKIHYPILPHTGFHILR